MKKLFFLIALMGPLFLHSQEYKGTQADRIIPGSLIVRYGQSSDVPDYIKFSERSNIPADKIVSYIKTIFKLGDDVNFRQIRTDKDQFGFEHIRYQQFYKNYPVQSAIVVVHTSKNRVQSVNGTFLKSFMFENQLTLNIDEARNSAITSVKAERFKWQMPEEEALLKKVTGSKDASYFPKGEVVCIQRDEKMFYSYKFDIYADKPLSRTDVYVDAQSGKIIQIINKIHIANTNGTAVTKYSGQQTVATDSYNNAYRLRETTRGLGVETYNLNKGTSYGTATDFTDDDNFWNNVNANKDEVATDAHWAAEKTYDYYFQKFGRNSIDGQGFKIMSYVHYQTNYANAFWDGQRMTYGDGDATMGPLVSLDIVGHEITHGLTENTANLTYQNESGALNEGFSDIFATCIEYFAKPTTANWTMGEDIGSIIRSMSNPNSYQQPDTYLGQNWYTGTADNGGVHTNSGVINYWFYLLSNGGSGTNDINQAFNVSGVGVDTAAMIAYRTLTTYLTPSSNYADARYYAIMSAIDLFGACSPQVASTTNAFYAVGIGTQYMPGVDAQFNTDIISQCSVPVTVSFENQSNNGINYVWDFGDGTTSTSINPSHTYTQFGSYTVKLITYGGSCGQDSIIKSEYLNINPTAPCTSFMPPGSAQAVIACNGTLFDNGGSQNYTDNTTSVFTIRAPGASSVTLNFTEFETEASFDVLTVYNGQTVSATQIGQYSGTNLPNGGTINSTGDAVTLKFVTDQGLNMKGFRLTWSCVYPQLAPDADFAISDTASCTGEIKFTDISLYGPSAWHWDFGDGTTSASPSPVHNYTQNGTYTVKLISTNTYGVDSVLKTNLIVINRPVDPIAVSAQRCGSGSLTLSASANGRVNWYNSLTSALVIDTGTVLNTGVLSQSTIYYVENEVLSTSVFGGKTNNTGGGSNFAGNAQHYEVFDVFEPCTLKSVLVYAQGAGDRTIELQNSAGTILDSLTVNLSNGTSRAVLNFKLVPGTNYRLAAQTTPNLYRNNAGCAYPYNIGTYARIKSSSATTNPTNYYYFFYDWEIQGESCRSQRVAVNAFVNSGNPVSDFNYSFNSAANNWQFTSLSTDANSYSWNFGDGGTSTQANPSHNFASAQSYTVWLKTINACGVDSVSKVVDNSMIGIRESKQENILIYPNPSNDRVQFSFNNTDPQAIVVYDQSGRVVLNENLNGAETYVMNVSSFAKGMYIATIRYQTKLIHRKIVVR